MDLPDFEAEAEYWDRQAELHPQDQEIQAMRIMSAAEYLVQLAVIEWFNAENDT